MADLTTWTGGALVDGEVTPPRPRAFLGGLLLFLLVIDLLLEVVLGGPPPHDPEIEDAAGARAVLRAAATDPKTPWLLIGDSVLAGDVMRGKVDDWEHHRVIDAMRASVNPDAGASFHQVALDAMLPVDIRHLLVELDAVDPAARVPVVIEINPRYFSPSYAALAECTRPWLCELGPRVVDAKHRLRWDDLVPYYAELGRVALGDLLPIVRHHARLARDPLAASMGELIAPEGSGDGDLLSARARILAHYRDLALGGTSTQIQALKAIVDRLRRSGRKAVFFTTPLEDGFAAQAMSPLVYGHYTGVLARTIEGRGGPNVSLVNLDHPLFGSPLFLDHCHLGPEGNRRLAVNLLAELGIGLAEVPEPDALVHLDAPDRTLVARIDQGSSDGAAWQAQFRDPVGVAVTRDGARVVLTDTGNHVVRELAGRLQTVRATAGLPGRAGHRDGPAHNALLDSPSHPAIVGDHVYFADQKGKSMRVLSRGAVGTVKLASGPKWERIDGMVALGTTLLVLDDGKRVLRLDPAASTTTVVAEAAPGFELQALTVAPDGRVFLVDVGSRIWVGHVDAPMTIGPAPVDAELEFENLARDSMPQVRGLYFPLGYDALKLEHVVGIQWVERYQALLVQDDHAPKTPVKGLTERVHLRLLVPATRLVYPWLKPMVQGSGYWTYNKRSDSYVTPIHLGSMALAQDTATLFYLERERSRLFALADGILGTAKLGFIGLNAQGAKYLLGVPASTATLGDLHPDHHLGARLEALPRRGPFLGALFGSSMLSTSDMIGTYAFGVRFEEVLRDALGYRDGIRFDLVSRSYPGVRSEKLLQELRNFVETGAQPDVIFIEMAGTRTRERFFERDASEERMREVLAEVDAIARIHDSMVVFLDTSALVSERRDGLRPVNEAERKFAAMATAAGFTVVSIGDELLRDALDDAPIGSPPFGKHHASPWGIDAAATLAAKRSVLPVRAWLQDRVPSWMRPPFDGQADPDALVDAFAAVASDWAEVVTPLPAGALQFELTGETLEVFVDVGRLELGEDAAALEDAAVAALWSALVGDPVGTRARRVNLRLARFRRYDEYGAGVRDAAEILLAWELDRAALVERLTAYRQRG